MNIKVYKEKVITNNGFTKVESRVIIRNIPSLHISIWTEAEQIFKHYRLHYTGLELTFNVSGTARCSPDDTYNKYVGLDLAEDRAEKKAYEVAKKILYFVIDKLAEIGGDIRYFINDRLDSKLEKTESKMKTRYETF